MAGKNNWKFSHLEDMNYNDFVEIFENIPSGSESEDGEEEEDEEKEEEISDAPNSLNRPLFCNIDERMNEENNVNTDDDYSDSDFVPLAEVVRRENVKKFIWKSTVSTCIVPQQFCESGGPCNLPDDADTPSKVKKSTNK
ncbi:hypothetical protein QE152_g33445 [Popillia japonica]|uniref:PiggyBac transposable element-derived protein domain-containing protein n=1 Tax=Popillia japonica TaxID=7064 RepID=A0AAW1IWU1_POPJA